MFWSVFWHFSVVVSGIDDFVNYNPVSYWCVVTTTTVTATAAPVTITATVIATATAFV